MRRDRGHGMPESTVSQQKKNLRGEEAGDGALRARIDVLVEQLERVQDPVGDPGAAGVETLVRLRQAAQAVARKLGHLGRVQPRQHLLRHLLQTLEVVVEAADQVLDAHLRAGRKSGWSELVGGLGSGGGCGTSWNHRQDHRVLQGLAESMDRDDSLAWRTFT